jgi:hypothetical protein
MVMRKYIFGIALLAMSVVVAGCILIDDVDMPGTACEYSSFHVTIDTHIDEDGEEDTSGMLGILVPVGWEPINVVYSGTAEGEGVYYDWLSDSIDDFYPAPEGYLWWGYLTEEYLQGFEGDEYGIDFDILTDGQQGVFYLDFMVGHFWGMYPAGVECSEDNEIVIIPDQEDPYITDTYPHDGDWPSGVPPSEDTAGCHWNAGDSDVNSFIDVDESTFEVRDSDDNPVAGELTIDDSDPYDVIVNFEADGLWAGGETYTVETTTYDMAANSATESWDFTAGYLNIDKSSYGAVKALFR